MKGKSIVLGVVFVFSGLSYLGYKRAEALRNYLEREYGRKKMDAVLVNIIWMGMNTVGIFEGVSNLQALAEISKVIG